MTVNELYSKGALAWKRKSVEVLLLCCVELAYERVEVKVLMDHIPSSRTNRSAANYGHLALSLLRRHGRGMLALEG